MPGQDAPSSVAESDPSHGEPSGADDREYRLAEPTAVPSPETPAPSGGEDWVVDQSAKSTFEPTTDTGEDAAAAEEFPAELPPVDEVWSRWAEWKEPAIWTAAGVAASLLIWLGGAWVSALVFLLALAFGAYHIIISLEVPVRVTPEQAVREFYGSLNHRLPNFPRMYWLLTADGKQSESFANFADFRLYWKSQVARLTRSPLWMVPLEFGFEGFKCRYNGDRNLAAVRYKLRVAPRGSHPSDGPIAQFDMKNLAVKGADGQWYLNEGFLPDPNESNHD